MTFECPTSVRFLGDRIRVELDLRFWPDQELKLGSSHSREVAVVINGHARPSTGGGQNLWRASKRLIAYSAMNRQLQL